MNKKVLIAAPVHSLLIDGLQQLSYECIQMPAITQQQAYEVLPACVGVITSTRLMLDAPLLDACPQLKWIGRMGSGMEVIDTAYADKIGVTYVASPEGNCNAVGEHALGMLLTLIRKINTSQAELQHGVWKRDENRGMELVGKTIGIIGLGHTGRAFAKKLQGFDLQILAFDKYNTADIPAYVYSVDLFELQRDADIISFHVPLLVDTFYYFNDEFLAALKKPVIIINTSRGKVVSMETLFNGLNTGQVRGACLDVFEEEPPVKLDAGLREKFDTVISMPNVIATPHIAGYTYEALFKMSNALLQKITLLTKG